MQKCMLPPQSQEKLFTLQKGVCDIRQTYGQGMGLEGTDLRRTYLMPAG